MTHANDPLRPLKRRIIHKLAATGRQFRLSEVWHTCGTGFTKQDFEAALKELIDSGKVAAADGQRPGCVFLFYGSDPSSASSLKGDAATEEGR